MGSEVVHPDIYSYSIMEYNAKVRSLSALIGYARGGELTGL